MEISIIEEAQPRWLSFLNGQHDYIDRLPPEFIEVAMPGGRVAPHLAKQGVRGAITLVSDVTFTYFNMDDPVVGGLAPPQVALRRAISLATDVQREIRLVRRGMAIPAQSPVMPHLRGYDPAFKSEMSQYNCTAMSTATATAGANGPTASRCCCRSRPSPTSRAASSTNCARRTWTRSASVLNSRPRSGPKT